MEFPPGCLNDHDRASQVDECAVVLRLSLPTNSETTEVVVPAIGAFNYPTSRLAAHAADQGRLAPTPDVWPHAALAGLILGVVVVVPFVQADMLGPSRPARPTDEDGIERGTDHPLVVNVGAGQRDGERNSAPIGQNMAFCAEFSAIGRIGASEVPPFGAFTEALSSDAHSRSRPHFSW